MTKRGITQVMRKTSGSYNRSKIVMSVSICLKLRIPMYDFCAYYFAKGPTYTAYLQTVCESCVHKIIFRHREYLSLVLQLSKWMGEYDSIIILLKSRTEIRVVTLILFIAVSC